MQGSIFNKCKTDPVVNGGTYEFTRADGRKEGGIIMGVLENNKGEVEGYLYHFLGGPHPVKVVEGTESMAHWKLVTAPTKSSAAEHKKQHAKKLALADKENAKPKAR